MSELYGAALLGGAVNAGAGLVNNIFGAERERIARKENYEYGEKAANAADARTRELYNDLYGIEAQMQQVKNAGLSPSMFYGDLPGTSGQSGAIGTGATGISPTIFGIDPLQGAALAKITAETENIKADTKNKEKDIDVKEANITNLLADAGAKEAATAQSKAEVALKNMQTKVASHNALAAYYEALDKGLTYEFNQQTFDARKEQEANKVALLAADIARTKAETTLNQQQVKELESRIAKMYEEIQIEWTNALANDTSANAWANFLNSKTEYLERELELEAERLGIQKTKMWIDATLDGVKATLTAIETGMTLGKGSYTTPAPSMKNYNPNTNDWLK